MLYMLLIVIVLRDMITTHTRVWS